LLPALLIVDAVVSPATVDGDNGALSPSELAQFTLLAASAAADIAIINLRMRTPDQGSREHPRQELSRPSNAWISERMGESTTSTLPHALPAGNPHYGSATVLMCE